MHEVTLRLTVRLQDMEVAVGLNLFTSRMGERRQALVACLHAASPALQAAAASLAACSAICASARSLAPQLHTAEASIAALPVSRTGPHLTCDMTRLWHPAVRI